MIVLISDYLFFLYDKWTLSLSIKIIYLALNFITNNLIYIKLLHIGNLAMIRTNSLLQLRLCYLRVRLDTGENWKYYNKIIFKFVNSSVWLIFNEKVAEKWCLWVPWTVHGTHLCGWKVIEKSNCAAKKIKKKPENSNAHCGRANLAHTKFILYIN